MKEYVTYILYSEKLNRFYIGQTDNLYFRLKRHNNGLVNTTKPGIPWRLLWQTLKPNRSEAVRLERKLKNLNKDRLRQFITKYSNDET